MLRNNALTVLLPPTGSSANMSMSLKPYPESSMAPDSNCGASVCLSSIIGSLP